VFGNRGLEGIGEEGSLVSIGEQWARGILGNMGLW